MSERPKLKKISKAAFKKSLRLFQYFSGYKWLFFIGLFCLLVSSTTSLFIITLLGRLVDSQQSELLEKVVDVSLILGGLLIIQATASYFRIYTFGIVTENAIARIRQQVFGHLVRLPMPYFGKKRVGELSSRISADIATVQGALTTYIAEFIRQCITIVGALAIMSFTSLRLALFMLSTLPLMAFVAVFFGRFVRRLSKKMQGQVADSTTIVEETLQAIATVKAFVGEYFEISRYKDKTREIVRTGIKNAIVRGAFASLLIVFIFGSIVAIVWYGSGLVAKNVITDGDLFNFLFLSVFMAGSLSGLANTYSQIQKAIGSTENLFDILEEPLEIPTIQKPATIINKIKGKVTFDNVSFSYPDTDSKTVLDKLSFTVKAGCQVALVGASGAGKTTITSLLLRLYNTDAGKIYIDDKPIKSFALQDYRRQLALVPQDIVLFGGTIQENIRYGKNDASENAIEAAAKLANAHHFITSFPKGYQTIVGERGTKLSGGQRQRVAIARAILANPAILILDEATSALDSSSELKVQQALAELLKNRTSFVVAHRLSTIRNADVILVLDNGSIVESGTHEDLIKNENGYYKRYYDLQAGQQTILAD